MLKKYVDMGKLERVRKGIYVITDGFADEYALLQEQDKVNPEYLRITVL